MNRDQIFPIKYFKAASVAEPIHLKIVAATMESLKNYKGEDVRKLVLTFEDCPTRLIMNATRYDDVAGLFGDDTEQWIGHSIQLYATTMRIGGKTVETVRICESAEDE